MARMKTFLIYLLILVAFYIVSSILAYWYIQTTYSTIESHVIENPNIQVAIDDAEATLVNGYVSGTITNTSEEAINTIYIKFKRDKCIKIKKKNKKIKQKIKKKNY